LITPGEHHQFDASGMVRGSVTPGQLRAVGDTFTMEMTYGSGHDAEHYRTDNVVTRLEPLRCVEWAVAPAGGEPLGWRWRYELRPFGSGGTEVTLVYDWAGTPVENVRRFGVPLFTEADLAASLGLLAATVADEAH
jgi:hypothetical protein